MTKIKTGLEELEEKKKAEHFLPPSYERRIGETKAKLLNLQEEFITARTRMLVDLVNQDLEQSDTLPDEFNLHALLSQDCIAEPLCRINELTETARDYSLEGTVLAKSKDPDEFASKLFVDTFSEVIMSREINDGKNIKEVEKILKDSKHWNYVVLMKGIG